VAALNVAISSAGGRQTSRYEGLYVCHT
jgi:hypothetical protein